MKLSQDQIIEVRGKEGIERKKFSWKPKKKQQNNNKEK